jgi:hypothetical protein
VDTPDGGYIVHHRGSGYGEDFEGGKIVFKATPDFDYVSSCTQPEEFALVAKLEGRIILPPGQLK